LQRTISVRVADSAAAGTGTGAAEELPLSLDAAAGVDELSVEADDVEGFDEELEPLRLSVL
jgi:hypothetical protein